MYTLAFTRKPGQTGQTHPPNAAKRTFAQLTIPNSPCVLLSSNKIRTRLTGYQQSCLASRPATARSVAGVPQSGDAARSRQRSRLLQHDHGDIEGADCHASAHEQPGPPVH